MKIGLYISPSHAVPPDEKNILAPWVLVGQLADGLVNRGHDVVLFAAKGSSPRTATVRGKTHTKLIHGGIEPTIRRMRTFPDPDGYRSYVVAQELALMREAIGYAKAGKIDVLHIHQPVERLYPALLAMPARVPIVVTFHDPIIPERFPALEKLVALGNVHFVSLSVSQQRSTLPAGRQAFPFAGVVPNGIDTKVFAFDRGNWGKKGNQTKDQRPLLITGRIVKEKGFSDAIEAAKQAGERLMMVGQPYGEYFEKEIQPEVDGKTVIWEPAVQLDHLIGHYQTAKALLFPIQWEEPFGLVMIEAMACGTPVIAYKRGSVPEIVADGKTGFVVDPKHGVDGLVAAIRNIGKINPKACRKHVEKYFTIQRMVEGYEGVYEGLIRHK